MATYEFVHDHGPRPDKLTRDNCGACALTNLNQISPNYAAWPLAYMENGRTVPLKWFKAFIAEMNRKDNEAYAENVRRKVELLGVRFSSGSRYTRVTQDAKGHWSFATEGDMLR